MSCLFKGAMCKRVDNIELSNVIAVSFHGSSDAEILPWWPKACWSTLSQLFFFFFKSKSKHKYDSKIDPLMFCLLQHRICH